MNKKGFTLVELLAVIAILGTLLTLATVNVIKIMNDSKDNVGEFTKSQIEEVAKLYALENDCSPDCTFEGSDTIINNLGTYYPQMESKCEITEDSMVKINENDEDITVKIENITCKE